MSEYACKCLETALKNLKSILGTEDVYFSNLKMFCSAGDAEKSFMKPEPLRVRFRVIKDGKPMKAFKTSFISSRFCQLCGKEYEYLKPELLGTEARP